MEVEEFLGVAHRVKKDIRDIPTQPMPMPRDIPCREREEHCVRAEAILRAAECTLLHTGFTAM